MPTVDRATRPAAPTRTPSPAPAAPLAPTLTEPFLGATGSYAKDLVDCGAFAVGLADPVEGLRPGQAVTITAQGAFTRKELKAGGGGDIAVSREDDGTYTISAGMSVSAGVEIESENAELEAAVTRGAQLTFKARSAAEASAIVRDLRADAQIAAAATFQTGVAGLGALGGAAGAAYAVNDLAPRARSVETRVQADGAASIARFPSNGERAAQAAIDAGVSLSGTSTLAVRVEVDDSGKKTAVFEERARVAGGFTLGVTAQAATNLELETEIGAEREAEVIFRQTQNLADDFDMRLAALPELVAAAAQGPAVHETVLKTKATVGRGVVEGELTVQGSAADVLRTARAFLDGDLTASPLPMKGTVTRSVTSGAPLGFDVGVAEGEVGLTRSTQISKVNVESVEDLAKELAKGEVLLPVGHLIGSR